MVTNPHVQNRVKHFDQLLSREIELIQRQHEQALVRYKKLEQNIRYESKKIPKCTRQKISIPLEEIHNGENQTNKPNKKRMHTDDDSREKFNISIENFNHRSNQSNEKPTQPVLKYRRLCTKSQRLPPIVPSHIPRRDKRSNNNPHWRTNFQQSNKENDNMNDIVSALNEQFSKRTARETTETEEQVESFKKTLPKNEGVQKGFDNFAPSALYSTRATVAMR